MEAFAAVGSFGTATVAARTPLTASLAAHAAALDPAGVVALLPADQPAGFAILQGDSLEAAEGVVGPDGVATFRQGAVDLAADVRAAFPATRLVLTETVARPAGNAVYPSDYADPAAMQADIRTASDAAAAGLRERFGANTELAPVGDVFAELGFATDLYADEAGHPSGRGAVAAAMTVYVVAFDGDASDDLDYFALSSLPAVRALGFEAFADLATTVDEVVARVNVAQDEAFVRRMYANVLGRAPEPAGLAHWTNHLANGVSREQVADGVVNSAENWLRQVRQAYGDLLGREATAAELAQAAEGRQSFDYYASTIDGFRATLLVSDEYKTRAGGTFDAQVRQWYRDLFGREATAGEVDGLSYLESLGTFAQMSFGLYNLQRSTEVVRRQVEAAYQRYLGRQPDAAGLADILTVLGYQTGSTLPDLWLIESSEYYNRAG